MIANGQTLYVVTGAELEAFGETIAKKVIAACAKPAADPYKAMTKSKVADMFDVDTRTITNWIEKKLIKATRIGGIVRIDNAEVKHLQEMKS